MTPAKIDELVEALKKADIVAEFRVDPGHDETCITWLEVRFCGHEATVEYRPKEEAFGLYTRPNDPDEYGMGPDTVVKTIEEVVQQLMVHFLLVADSHGKNQPLKEEK